VTGGNTHHYIVRMPFFMKIVQRLCLVFCKLHLK
jgi:hypothetical protein